MKTRKKSRFTRSEYDVLSRGGIAGAIVGTAFNPGIGTVIGTGLGYGFGLGINLYHDFGRKRKRK